MRLPIFLIMFCLFLTACSPNSYPFDEDLLLRSKQLYPIQQAGQMGLINELGEVVIPLQADTITKENRYEVFYYQDWLIAPACQPYQLKFGKSENFEGSFVFNNQIYWVKLVLEENTPYYSIHNKHGEQKRMKVEGGIFGILNEYIIFASKNRDYSTHTNSMSIKVYDTDFNLALEYSDFSSFATHPQQEHLFMFEKQGYTYYANLKNQKVIKASPKIYTTQNQYTFLKLTHRFFSFSKDTLLLMDSSFVTQPEAKYKDLFRPKDWSDKEIENLALYQLYNHNLDPISTKKLTQKEVEGMLPSIPDLEQKSIPIQINKQQRLYHQSGDFEMAKIVTIKDDDGDIIYEYQIGNKTDVENIDADELFPIQPIGQNHPIAYINVNGRQIWPEEKIKLPEINSIPNNKVCKAALKELGFPIKTINTTVIQAAEIRQILSNDLNQVCQKFTGTREVQYFHISDKVALKEEKIQSDEPNSDYLVNFEAEPGAMLLIEIEVFTASDDVQGRLIYQFR